MIQQTLTHASCYKLIIPDGNFPDESEFLSPFPKRLKCGPGYKRFSKRSSIHSVRNAGIELTAPNPAD